MASKDKVPSLIDRRASNDFNEFVKVVRGYEQMCRAVGLYRIYEWKEEKGEHVARDETLAALKPDHIFAEIENNGIVDMDTVKKLVVILINLPFVKVPERFVQLTSNDEVSFTLSASARDETQLKSFFRELWTSYKNVVRLFNDNSTVNCADASRRILARVETEMAGLRQGPETVDIHVELDEVFRFGQMLPNSGYLSCFAFNYEKLVKGNHKRVGRYVPLHENNTFKFYVPRIQNYYTDKEDVQYHKRYFPTKMSQNMETDASPLANTSIWIHAKDEADFKAFTQPLSAQYIRGTPRAGSLAGYVQEVIIPHLLRVAQHIAHYVYYEYQFEVNSAIINNSSQQPDTIEYYVGKKYPHLHLYIRGSKSSVYASKNAMRLVKRCCLIPVETEQFKVQEIYIRKPHVMQMDTSCSSVERFIPVDVDDYVGDAARNSYIPTLLSGSKQRPSIQLLNSCLLIQQSSPELENNEKSRSCFDQLRDEIKKVTGNSSFMYSTIGVEMGADWDREMQRNFTKRNTQPLIHHQNKPNQENLRVNKLVSYFLLRYTESLVLLAAHAYPGIVGLSKVLRTLNRLYADNVQQMLDLMVTVTNGTASLNLDGQMKLPLRNEAKYYSTEIISLAEVIEKVRPLTDEDEEGFHTTLSPSNAAEFMRQIYKCRLGHMPGLTSDDVAHVTQGILHNASIFIILVKIITIFQKGASIELNGMSIREYFDADPSHVSNMQSLRDAVYALFLFNVYSRKCGHVDADPDFGQNIVQVGQEVVRNLCFGDCFAASELQALGASSNFLSVLGEIFKVVSQNA